MHLGHIFIILLRNKIRNLHFHYLKNSSKLKILHHWLQMLGCEINHQASDEIWSIHKTDNVVKMISIHFSCDCKHRHELDPQGLCSSRQALFFTAQQAVPSITPDSLSKRSFKLPWKSIIKPALHSLTRVMKRVEHHIQSVHFIFPILLIACFTS